jgi:hypothetical protein
LAQNCGFCFIPLLHTLILSKLRLQKKTPYLNRNNPKASHTSLKAFSATRPPTGANPAFLSQFKNEELIEKPG